MFPVIGIYLKDIEILKNMKANKLQDNKNKQDK